VRTCKDCSKAIPPRNQSGRCKVCNGKAALATRDLGLDWLPDEWRRDYHNWISNKGFTAIEARRIIMDHIAVRGGV
jgi:hypothetical protein